MKRNDIILNINIYFNVYSRLNKIKVLMKIISLPSLILKFRLTKQLLTFILLVCANKHAFLRQQRKNPSPEHSVCVKPIKTLLLVP